MQLKPTPPPKPTSTQYPQQPQDPAVFNATPPAPGIEHAPDHKVEKKSKKGLWAGLVIGLLALILSVAAIVSYVWYKDQLTSPTPNSDEVVRLTVQSGDTSRSVAAELAQQGVIKNEFAFNVYYRLHHTSGLKTGIYNIERNLSVGEIVAHLEDGEPDEFTLTFLPGGTVSDAKKVLVQVGYTAAEVDEAMNANYDHPLLEEKPTNVDLEGYIYGDTYNFFSGSSVKDVLTRIFDHMQEDIEANNLRQAYAARDMTLYEGIIFASIVQSEVPDKEDMPVVSQVFHKRLATDMQLGSDVTFIYGARKLGVAPSVDLDSPYNTRTVKGLTPTPVSNPGLDALVAGANPSDTDYLYFVAGDDGVTRYSATLAEHERLTRETCSRNCMLPPQ